MRIDGSGRTNNVARPRGAGSASSASNVFSLADAGQSQAAADSSPMAGIGGIDALLALQSVEDKGGKGERLRHGHEMLDLLDEIKIALLSGQVPAAKLESLLGAVSRRPGRLGEERLEAVLDEIELRARVELAKLGREAA